jgi:tripartite-type tricarboxylate transporter receptor subunit TctC
MLKNFAKKSVAALAVGGIAVTASVAPAAAEYPEKPITMVIPFGPGGSHDLNGRVITSIIPSYLDQAVIVRLTPGAGGQKGTQEVANAPADGYTLLFTHNYTDMLQQHVDSLPYNPIEDFVTVARVNYAPVAVAVRADSPYETFDDLLAASKSEPGSVQMAHSGNWGAFFIPAAQMMTALDIQWNLVPYQGGGPALQALLSGDADVTMGFPSSLSSHVEAGTVRILATAGAERLYEEIPTFAEVGVEGDVGFMHRVVLAPADTPEDVLVTLRTAFQELAEDTTFTRMMGRLGENIDIIVGDEYDAMRVDQSTAYEELVNVLTAN